MKKIKIGSFLSDRPDMSVSPISAIPSYYKMNPDYIEMSRDDVNLPLIYPLTGKVPEKSFESLIEIMCEKVFPYSPYVENPTYAEIVNGFTGDERLPPIDHIRRKMTKQKLAVIRQRSTGALRVDLSKRVCQRHTFGSKIVSELSDLVVDFLGSHLRKESNIKISDVKLDPTHGDILYYEEGGVFELHVDGINKFPFGENEVDEFDLPRWRMYTLLIGLDSNLTPMSLSNGDGNTVVYLPEQTFLQHVCRLGVSQDPNILHSIFDLNVTKNRHSFIESCQKGHFLLFSSEALHASNKIMQNRGFKMAMKLDVWIETDTQFNYKGILTSTMLESLGHLSDGYIPSTDSYNPDPIKDERYLYHNILVNPHKCRCIDCNKYLLKMEVYYKNIAKIFLTTKLNSNVCRIISEFVIDNKSKERCFRNSFYNCSCHKCFPRHYDQYNYYDDDYDEYDRYEDRYDDCNGYCNGY